MKTARPSRTFGLVSALALLALAPAGAAQSFLGHLDGVANDDRYGASVARFHDLNADGWLDYLVGSPSTSNVLFAEAAVHVVSGRYLATGQGVAVLARSEMDIGTDYGASVVQAGDFDGDGWRDFLAGAPGYSTSVFGFTRGAVLLANGNNGSTNIVLGEAYESLGTSVALFEDVNGDGYLDVLAGAPTADIPVVGLDNNGRAVILSGLGLIGDTKIELRVHNGTQDGERCGTSLAVGDVTGDFFSDYVLGSPHRTSGGGVPDSGRVRVYEGMGGSVIREIAGGPGSMFGASLSMELDVTGDGVRDLVVGAPHSSVGGAQAGSVYVYSGAALAGGGILLPVHAWHGSAGSRLGTSVAAVDDMNGDGVPDVAAGAPGYSFLGQNNGQVRMWSGATGELLGSILGASQARIGSSVTAAYAVDGKPGSELLVGSAEASIGGPNRGRVSLLTMWPSPPRTYCTAKQNSLGCTPFIHSTGTPGAGAGSAFRVRASNMLNNVTGVLIYGYDANAAPFQGGTLCVSTPIRRTSGQVTGGTPPPTKDCSGTFDHDFAALIQAGTDPALTLGRQVFCQYWSRDKQSPSGTNLSNGLAFLINP